MTDDKPHKPMPVHGYTPQSSFSIDLANKIKEQYERTQRVLDHLRTLPEVDQRDVSIAITELENSSMRAVRAVFKPKRVTLPEDGA